MTPDREPRPRVKPEAREESAKARPRRERSGQGSNGLDDARTGRHADEVVSRKPLEDRVFERLEANITTAADAEGVSFEDLGLDPRLVEALAEIGAEEPFPIQVATIPDALGGKHVLGRGRTGSGKTIAFGAALVQRLFWMHGKRKKGVGRAPLALILVPTRELALQLDRTIQPLARALGLFTTQIYGGVGYTKQNTSLKRGVDIVIGTPGRVEDLERRGHLDLSQIAITVLDEADEMSAMGFIEPVERILDLTKPTGQRMLFSATLDAAVLGLVAGYMPNPAVHELDEDAVGEIEHRVLIVERREREAVLAQLAGSGGRVLIFRRMRAGAEDLAVALRTHGVAAVALHGDLSQPERTANLEQFTNGKVNALVATDVAARGIHVDDVRLVVQADPPDEYKTYLHRAGRTGRAGNRGIVVTLVQPGRERRMIELLERAEIDAPMIPAGPGSASLDEFMA
uniref:DEAD/DEAH box helicase n=1 Tax=Gulosibacter chungangensis TaxID=979746 RepID=UPI001CE44DB1|nr:DEAD/DEAH box helicase [Gulosibacter chungangensis]